MLLKCKNFQYLASRQHEVPPGSESTFHSYSMFAELEPSAARLFRVRLHTVVGVADACHDD